MDETKRKIVNVICLVLIVILAVIFGVLAYSSQKEEMRERERLLTGLRWRHAPTGRSC